MQEMADIPLHRATQLIMIPDKHPWARSAEQLVGPRPEIQAIEDKIWRQVRENLTTMNIKHMVTAFNRQMENDADKIPAEASADQLFNALRTVHPSCILIWLQGLLYHENRDLFDLVARMAESSWPPLKIPHYSRVDCGRVRPETPPGYRLISMYVDFKWPRLLEQMIHLKEELARLLEIDPDTLYIAEFFYADSAWITVLIPEHVVKDKDEEAFIQHLKNIPEIRDAKFGDPPVIEETSAQAGTEMTASPSSSPSASDSTAKSASSEEEEHQQLARTLDLIRKKTQKRKAEADSTLSEEPSKRARKEAEEAPEEAKRRKKFKMEQQWRNLRKDDFLEHIKKNPAVARAAKILEGLPFDIKTMAALTTSALQCMGMSKQEARGLLAESEELGVFETEITTKVINDGLFGHLEFPLLCMKIIDTPEFQRLRHVKQLGSAYLVYPGAMHSRFQHSVGVAYLARKVVKALQKHQPSLDITEEDVLCVTIAGLCRDLGKGPHSHLFTKFMHTLHAKKHAGGKKGKSGKKGKQAETEKKWKPASTSLKMFDYLIEKNNAEIKKEMRRMGLDNVDIEFIREQIQGNTMDPKDYKGREPEKHFLYEIVASRRNGIDVVRWDDIARDAAMLGLPVVFDHRRFVKHVRVVETDDGEEHICARDKDADDHYKISQARHMLGRRAYFHKVNQAVEAMYEDVLLLVEESDMRFRGMSNKTLKLSECVDDPVAFSNLNDGIFHAVEMSTSDSLAKARGILQNIKERRLYKMMVETIPHKRSEDYPSKFDQDRPNGVAVKQMYIDFGWEDEDPLTNMWFYKKDDPMQAVKIGREKVSTILPEKFAECITRLFCDPSDGDTLKKAVEDFEGWCKKYSLATEKSLQ